MKLELTGRLDVCERKDSTRESRVPVYICVFGCAFHLMIKKKPILLYCCKGSEYFIWRRKESGHISFL